MAEASQYKFGLTEVAELLVKKQGLHEGMWMATVEITTGFSIMGPTAETSYPTALIQIPNIILSQAPANILPGTAGLVDAAGVNPRNKARVKA